MKVARNSDGKTKEFPTEPSTDTNELFSSLTLNEEHIYKLEEVMNEIFDSETRYTEDMKTTIKVINLF